MDFESLIGKECSFYGVDCNRFRLGFEGEVYTYEAVEDEDDGYRSMMSEVLALANDVGTFQAQPFATVIPCADPKFSEERRHCGGQFSGYGLVDAATGHVWLLLGTDDADDYYPCFTFDYQPSGELTPAGRAALKSTIAPTHGRGAS